jgi:phosphate transport system protein
MMRHFDLELADLKRSLITMGNLVERSLAVAVEAINHPNVSAREQCRSFEDQLDQMENAIEDTCHKLIALQRPAVSELRLVIAAMRITSELEQMGDRAESISKRAASIAKNTLIENPPELPALGELVLGMVRHTLESFLSGNLIMAKGVIVDEDESDHLTKECYHRIQEAMARNPALIKEYTHLLRGCDCRRDGLSAPRVEYPASS